MNMDFAANKIPVEVIKEGPFAGTYLRDIYSEFDELKKYPSGVLLLKLLWC